MGRYNKEEIERKVQRDLSQLRLDKQERIKEWESVHLRIESALKEVADDMGWDGERTIDDSARPEGRDLEYIQQNEWHGFKLQFNSGSQPDIDTDYQDFYNLDVIWAPSLLWVTFSKKYQEQNLGGQFYSNHSRDDYPKMNNAFRNKYREEKLHEFLGEAAKAYIAERQKG